MNDHPAQPDPLAALRALLAGRYPAWESWRGVVGGLLYVRRRKSSPPVVYRSTRAEDLAAKIIEWEQAHL